MRNCQSVQCTVCFTWFGRALPERVEVRIGGTQGERQVDLHADREMTCWWCLHLPLCWATSWSLFCLPHAAKPLVGNPVCY
jgi:hypothetical protein